MSEIGLCFRCEWRSQALEGRRQPRFECGDHLTNKWRCYMYKPVQPVILKADAEDPRPQFGGSLLSSRSECGGLSDDMVIGVMELDSGNVLFWRPKDKND